MRERYEVVKSDLSGTVIAPGDVVTVRAYGLGDEGRDRLLDVARAEAVRLFGDAGRSVARRGRPRKQRA